MITPPSASARADAAQRLDALAKPIGALGRLEELAAWVAGCQGACPPRPLDRVRAVVLAGDHGVSKRGVSERGVPERGVPERGVPEPGVSEPGVPEPGVPEPGVSAYPREVTAAMVRLLVAGHAGANVLARQHGVSLRVLDLAVDDDLAGLPTEVRRHKIRRSSVPINVADALSAGECERALAAGAAIADEEIDAGADVLVLGDLGIGNTTAATAIIAATFGVPADEVVGRGTGVDDERLAHKTAVITAALDRVGSRASDPSQRLAALGSADLAAGVGFLRTAARRGIPVLLDGIVSLAEVSVAEDLEPGVVAWCVAGHRSTEPAQQLALDKLGLAPVLDLGLRLGEGTGALAALPVLRSAVLLLREMALLADLAPAE